MYPEFLKLDEFKALRAKWPKEWTESSKRDLGLTDDEFEVLLHRMFHTCCVLALKNATLSGHVQGLLGDCQRIPDLVDELHVIKVILAVILKGDVIIRKVGDPLFIAEAAANRLHKDFTIEIKPRGNAGAEVRVVEPKTGIIVPRVN